ncbi:hypothetical protein Tsubulata_041791 [Turnera subulata]|uniref:F-box domain-containing protein n=1 Tax=Turnera subulata TaxID=218843 RepID=A0A9Q0JP60_9ROSI|nr:hypothetical protein Tsubulata_041791 [Turnera subulata]
MANTVTLPWEIVEEILALLPSKSIHRFRQVSKSWSSFSVSLEFHRFRTKSRPPETNLPKILERSIVNDGYVIESLDNLGGGEDHVRVCFPTDKDVCFVGSCNGLVCVAVCHVSRVVELVVWNPFTGTCRKLQDIDDFGYRMRRFGNGFSFGYDSVADDYKLGTTGNCLRLIRQEHKVGLFLNGALHWLVWIGCVKPKIIAFDLAKEKFYDVPELVLLGDEERNYKSLGVVGEYLCMHWVSRGNDVVDKVYVMKEYGNGESWVPFISYTSSGCVDDYVHFVCDFIPQAVKDGGYMILHFSGDLQHILKWDNAEETVESEEFFMHIRFSNHLNTMPYTESLTSPYPSFS